ncbi:MAG TPA: acyl-ACP--UDP-N-acetylglucosamine O-acyltransferase [Pirellulales bacterium]|nr:acyl-ACP--UDP-N-acetylglucosamine O-acyltransferase [Pirellulales bacterium]
MNIHPLAIVSPEAQLGRDVEIGPFAVIESDVVIGDRCRLASHVVVKDGTRMGPDNEICEAAVLGGMPQHVHKPAHLGLLILGSGNTIREQVTLHRAMKEGAATVLGDNNFLMVNSHVAHDCKLGNNIIMANTSLLAGHVTVGDRAFLSGGVGVHQFCRVGNLAMIGGHARLVQDVPPYMTVDSTGNSVVGLNLVGLRRNGFSTEEINQLKAAYRMIYRRGLRWTEMLEQLQTTFTNGPAALFNEFLRGGTRGFVQERRMPPGATIKLRPVVEENASEGADRPAQRRAKAG